MLTMFVTFGDFCQNMIQFLIFVKQSDENSKIRDGGDYLHRYDGFKWNGVCKPFFR